MLISPTLAAILLLCAGIIHNYSFMCRKVPKGALKVSYPTSQIGQLLLDLSWLLMAMAGLLICYQISEILCLIAAGIYFLLLPFLLQPHLARLLGFNSLTDYVETIDKNRQDK